MSKTIDFLSKSLEDNLVLAGYSRTDHTHKYAASSSVGGAATSANKLATAKTINGTSFDGSGNITTANWGTARNITIGSTSKSVNGSGNVSWTLAEVGAAAAVHNHTFVESIDTRSTNPAPNTYTSRGITPEFKSASGIGLPNVGKNFAGLITYQQWSDVSNWSGGKTTQLATIDDGRMYFRKGDGSGWGSWYQFYTTANKPTPSDIGAAAASHGTHLTIGTGASNAAAGNHTHSNYAPSSSTSLKTTDKTIVGAINELFQSANNGKQLIASAIGNDSINGNSTFEAMSKAILEIKRDITTIKDTLAGLMIEGGYNITGNENINDLLNLLILSGINISDIKQITCGLHHTFILKKDGSLWACGRNTYGQLGLGDTTARKTFTQVTTNINNDVEQVVGSYNHSFIIKKNGTIWACGENTYGQLGINSTVAQKTFTQVTTNISNVKQIACGYNHTMMLKNDGSLWGSGIGHYGQLGLGNTNNQKTFVKVTTNINNDVKQIFCGNSFTYILKNDGSIWSCGHNVYGQLGLGTNDENAHSTFTKVTTNINNDVKQIACGYYHAIILKNDNSVWGCGYNYYGQLGVGNTTAQKTFVPAVNVFNDVEQVICSGNHTFILKNNSTVWSCGYNNYGQLGYGYTDTSAHNVFSQVTTNASNDIEQVACGYYHTFILKNNGTVWSCGLNSDGQLGLGTNEVVDVFTMVPRGF